MNKVNFFVVRRFLPDSSLSRYMNLKEKRISLNGCIKKSEQFHKDYFQLILKCDKLWDRSKRIEKKVVEMTENMGHSSENIHVLTLTPFNNFANFFSKTISKKRRPVF